MHERDLRLIHQDYVSNVSTILVNANEMSTHQKCLEVYKYLNSFAEYLIAKN